jgi:hypothetical protein
MKENTNVYLFDCKHPQSCNTHIRIHVQLSDHMLFLSFSFVVHPCLSRMFRLQLESISSFFSSRLLHRLTKRRFSVNDYLYYIVELFKDFFVFANLHLRVCVCMCMHVYNCVSKSHEKWSYHKHSFIHPTFRRRFFSSSSLYLREKRKRYARIRMQLFIYNVTGIVIGVDYFYDRGQNELSKMTDY